MQDFELRQIVETILTEYALFPDGIHGVGHWARVSENGLKLADATGANVDVVRLFALFHDSKRTNDGHDPQHGQRGADYAKALRGSLFDLADAEFNRLYRACAGHTHELTHPDVTIQTCWDADRLDLGRVGITPHPSRLCTDEAKRSETINWAHGRACFHTIPAFVMEEWGIDLS